MAALLVSACGGGDGGVASAGSSAPTTGTTTTTTTTTTTPTSAADSAEYKASGAVVLAKAAYAYDKGITGKGVTIAVIDTGIDTSGKEFAGRISADSTAFDQVVARCLTCAPETIRFGIKDMFGHGSETASVAAAARDGSGVQGVAPDATILALKINGPNLSGVTATSGTIPEAETPNNTLIAPALRYAVDKGAFVVSLSLNGGASPSLAADQRAAMDAVRQGDRLLVESVSNDTGQDSFSGQIAETLVGTDRANKDWFLFAIGLDAGGTPRTANGNAGALADRMLAAAGNNVQAVDQNGNLTTITGNSFAAPAVAGAAALLKQYWPQLGGKAIARILLDTATDAGAPGVDPVYGAGILNIEKAMQAQAPAAAFSAALKVLSQYSSLVVSAPFGGAVGAAAVAGRVDGMTVYDLYGRDFHMAAPSGIRARGSGLLAGAMLAPADPPWLAASTAERRLAMISDPTGLWQSAQPNRPAMASFATAPGQTMTIGVNMGLGQGSGLAGSPLRAIASTPVGVSSSWTGRGWSAGLSAGATRDGRAALRTASLSSPLGVGLELSSLDERGQALGLRGGPAFGIRGATTTLVAVSVRRRLAGVLLSARATASTTRVRGGSELLRFDGAILGTAFAVEGARPLLGGIATLGVSSPLRVQHARAILSAPVAYDLISGTLTSAATRIDLSPTARELDLELGWSAALSPTASLKLGIARALDAGHVPGATDTAGFLTLQIR